MTTADHLGMIQRVSDCQLATMIDHLETFGCVPAHHLSVALDLRDTRNHVVRLRELVQCLIDNDPGERVSDEELNLAIKHFGWHEKDPGTQPSRVYLDLHDARQERNAARSKIAKLEAENAELKKLVRVCQDRSSDPEDLVNLATDVVNLQAALAACQRDTMERAAEIVDETAAHWRKTALGFKGSGDLKSGELCLSYNTCLVSAAAAIRAAIPTETVKTGGERE